MRFSKNAKVISLAFLLAAFVSCKGEGEIRHVKQVRFSWWGKEARSEYTKKGIEAFNSKNAYINVVGEDFSWIGYEADFEKEFLSGSSADVMQINFDWLDKYSSDGNGFFDLNNLSDTIELYNFTLDDLSYGTKNRKLNAIPVSFNTLVPIFSKKVFSDNGLNVPSTWLDLFECAKVLRKSDMYVLGLGEKQFFLLCLAWFEQTYSKKMFLDNATFTSSNLELISLFNFAQSLVTSHVVYPYPDTFSAQDLKTRRIAGVFVWCNESAKYAEAIDDNLGESVLGGFIKNKSASESGWYLKPALMYAIKKDTQNPKEAAKFMNYLLNDQSFALLQGNEKGVPASNKAFTSLLENNRLESLQYEALMRIRFNRSKISKMLAIMENSDIVKSFCDNTFDLASKKKSASEASDSFRETIFSVIR